MKVAIHQPNYLPYLGYFKKMQECDMFVYLDDCQFSNNQFHHYNKINTEKGPVTLKVPVIYHFGDKIKDVKIDNSKNWRDKHIYEIAMAHYMDFDFYELREIAEIIGKEQEYLADLNIKLIESIKKGFGIKCETIRSSELGIESTSQQRIIDICKKLGADTYLSGNGAKAYQVDEEYEKNGITIEYVKPYDEEYVKAGYKIGKGNYEPNMSVVDYIANGGYIWGIQ